jgi:hypothetical protein
MGSYTGRYVVLKPDIEDGTHYLHISNTDLLTMISF